MATKPTIKVDTLTRACLLDSLRHARAMSNRELSMVWGVHKSSTVKVAQSLSC